MEHIEYVYTVGMSEEDVEQHLMDAKTGVLALADGSRAYAVPVHCAYEGGVLVFRLTHEADSEKMAFLDATTEACFVLYQTTNGESWSILARGPVTRVDDIEQYDEAAINEQFGPARIFDEDIEETDIRLFKLDVESVTGRHTPLFD